MRLAKTPASGPMSLAIGKVSIPGGAQGEKQARLIRNRPNLSPKRAVVSMQAKLCDVKNGELEIVKVQEATNGGGLKLFHGSNTSFVAVNLRDRPSTVRDLKSRLSVDEWFELGSARGRARRTSTRTRALTPRVVREPRR